MLPVSEPTTVFTDSLFPVHSSSTTRLLNTAFYVKVILGLVLTGYLWISNISVSLIDPQPSIY